MATSSMSRSAPRRARATTTSTGPTLLPPLNIAAWIAEHREKLKPPVGNRCIFDDGDFIVMAVGGPNHRKDFHINPTDELFYQLEGDVVVRIIDAHGQVRDIPIRQGEMFMLPANVPHSPQRGAGTVGLVIERRRPAGEDDGLRFYCDRCGEVVFEERFELKDIAVQLKGVMEQFWSDATLRTCMQCGQIVQQPTAGAQAPSKDMAFPTAVRIGTPSSAAAREAKPAPSKAGGKAKPAIVGKAPMRASIDPRRRK